jgi:hypothetical protein
MPPAGEDIFVMSGTAAPGIAVTGVAVIAISAYTVVALIPAGAKM